MLEKKGRQGALVTKASVAVPGISLTDLARARAFRAWLRGLTISADLRERFLTLQPTAIVRYEREYYRSGDGRFRLTLDRDVTYHGLLGSRWGRPCKDGLPTLLELKYAVADDSDARRVTAELPYRLTRNSKYVRAIRRVFSLPIDA